MYHDVRSYTNQEQCINLDVNIERILCSLVPGKSGITAVFMIATIFHIVYSPLLKIRGSYEYVIVVAVTVDLTEIWLQNYHKSFPQNIISNSYSSLHAQCNVSDHTELAINIGYKIIPNHFLNISFQNINGCHYFRLYSFFFFYLYPRGRNDGYLYSNNKPGKQNPS